MATSSTASSRSSPPRLCSVWSMMSIPLGELQGFRSICKKMLFSLDAGLLLVEQESKSEELSIFLHSCATCVYILRYLDSTNAENARLLSANGKNTAPNANRASAAAYPKNVSWIPSPGT